MDEDKYNASLEHCSVIARPLAALKLCKKVLKLCKKATIQKQVKRGVKEVVKAIRKKQKGMVVLAGDIAPIDVITHVPVLCEDNSVPYVYVPNKEVLANAGQTRRPTSCLMVMEKPVKPDATADEELSTLYQAVKEKVQALEYL